MIIINPTNKIILVLNKIILIKICVKDLKVLSSRHLRKIIYKDIILDLGRLIDFLQITENRDDQTLRLLRGLFHLNLQSQSLKEIIIIIKQVNMDIVLNLLNILIITNLIINFIKVDNIIIIKTIIIIKIIIKKILLSLNLPKVKMRINLHLLIPLNINNLIINLRKNILVHRVKKKIKKL
jgi:hypothetical protein